MERIQIIDFKIGCLLNVYKLSLESASESPLCAQVEGYLVALTKELFEAKEETTETTEPAL